jgi:single-strand DNA-binding protein
MPYPTIIAEGNLVNDVELKTFGENTVASLRIACNSRKKDENGEWINTDPIYLDVSAWNGIGKNAATTFKKGDSIQVTGYLKQNNYTTKDGIKKTVDEIHADTIAIPVKRY